MSLRARIVSAERIGEDLRKGTLKSDNSENPKRYLKWFKLSLDSFPTPSAFLLLRNHTEDNVKYPLDPEGEMIGA